MMNTMQPYYVIYQKRIINGINFPSRRLGGREKHTDHKELKNNIQTDLRIDCPRRRLNFEPKLIFFLQNYRTKSKI